MDSRDEAREEVVEIGDAQYRVHRAATLFPIMSGREFEDLVEDVKRHGLREPVVVSGDQLIDGRNRVRACAAADVVPDVRELEAGIDPVSWVMSVNVHRRHLDASQRALLASRLCEVSGETTLSQAGELMGVSRASVARAAAVEKGPEPLKAAVDAGLVSVGDAYDARSEDPEIIEQLVEDVRSGEAPNLKAAKRKRGIQDKPRKKDPRGRKPKAGGAAGDRGDPGDAGGGIALGRLVDPEEPSLARSGSDPAVSESNPLFLGDDASQSGDENASAQVADLRRRAKLALGSSSVEASTVEEGAPWPAGGGCLLADRRRRPGERRRPGGGLRQEGLGLRWRGPGGSCRCAFGVGATPHGPPGAHGGLVRGPAGPGRRRSAPDGLGLPSWGR